MDQIANKEATFIYEVNILLTFWNKQTTLLTELWATINKGNPLLVHKWQICPTEPDKDFWVIKLFTFNNNVAERTYFLNNNFL